MSSIRRELLLWLLVGLTVTNGSAALVVYARARAEARALFDYQLQLMAAAFPNKGFGPAIAPPPEESGIRDLMVVQIWNRNGTLIYLSSQGAQVPQNKAIGFATVKTAQGEWRTYSTLVGTNVVQVSQSTRVRERLAASLALRAMLPLLILLPVLVAMIWMIVGRSLRPLHEVAHAVGTRSVDALEPLRDIDLPDEVRPLVGELNNLLERLGRSISLQRSFIADAAHELGTPLTALRLQLQVMERAADDFDRTIAIRELAAGIERAIRLVAQLLTLARNEQEVLDKPPVPLDLIAIAREIVAERSPLAEAKAIDLGLTAERAVMIAGDADGMRALLGNLVDNAINYTPRYGSIDVAVAAQDGSARLIVLDTGPGIPPADRERVFERFYRGTDAGGTGSGLGLTIVHNVAQRHGARVELGSGAEGRGLKVTIRFPGI